MTGLGASGAAVPAQHPHSLSLLSPFPLALSLIFLCMVSVFSSEVRTGQVPCVWSLFLLCLCHLSCLPGACVPFCVESIRRVGLDLCQWYMISFTCRLPCPFRPGSLPGCLLHSFFSQAKCLQLRPSEWDISFPPASQASPPVPYAVWKSFVWATATSSTGTRRCSA